jgi:hypothetical protein
LFLFSVEKGLEVLRVVEKRKSFSGTVLLGSRCVAWLISLLEEALRSNLPKDFEKSFVEDPKATLVRGRGNKASRFWELSVNAKGGWRGRILFLEGHQGQGWSRIFRELSKTLDFFDSTDVTPPSDALPVGSVLGKSMGLSSLTEVVCSPVHGSGVDWCDWEKMIPRSTVFVEARDLDLAQMETFGVVDDGRLVMKMQGLSIGSGRVWKAKKLGFPCFWRIFVKRVWAALKPKGFRVKSMRKMASSIQGPSVCRLGSGSDLKPDLDLILDVEADFGAISVLLASSPTSSVSSPTSPASPTTLVSSSTSPASQPSSLVFAGSSDEPRYLSVTQTETPSGFVDFNEGSESVSASDLPVPESQPLVNGLTEAQAWFFGWMRHGGQNHENLLTAGDHFEEQTQRDNEVAPPPDCSLELPQMKAELAAMMRDVDSWAITTKMGSDIGTDIGIRVWCL